MDTTPAYRSYVEERLAAHLAHALKLLRSGYKAEDVCEMLAPELSACVLMVEPAETYVGTDCDLGHNAAGQCHTHECVIPSEQS